MSVTSEIAALREWLREDETRLQSHPPEPYENVEGEKRGGDVYGFSDFGNREWGNGDGGWPWSRFGNSS
jgi:hypothetical protein